MSLFNPGAGVLACGVVSDGTHGATVRQTKGCSIPAVNSTGIYVCTLDQAAPAASCGIACDISGAAGVITVAHTSDTVKTFSTFAVDGTTATDKAFAFIVYQVAP